MTAVIITGGIDLSVGSTLGLAAMVTGIVLEAGARVWVGIAAALAASLVVGLVNGVLITFVRIPPFVATLGMLSAARSAGMVASQNKMVYQFGPDHELFLWLGGGSTLGIPNPVLVLGACCLVVGFALRWTRWGARIMAVGGNEKAAVLTGLPVKRIKIGIYMLSGFMAGLAGVLEASWLGGVTTNLGQSMELSVIAAAVIGGANLMGGGGTILGAVVGAALIEIIRNSLTLLGISTFWQGAFVGTFIVVAVAFDSVRGSRRNAAG
jgi:ribose transport system permease protein